MKITKFTLYGLLIGTLLAIFSGILFALIPVTLILGNERVYFDFVEYLVGYSLAGLFSAGFAFIPGAVGGAHLARWLEKSERTPRDVTRHSLLVGALAGLAASLACIAFILHFHVDWMVLVLVLLAVGIAAGMSLLTAKLLVRKKAKFVLSHPALQLEEKGGR